MQSFLLTDHSLRRPWLVIVLTLLATLLFALQFPKVKFDNDPENMLGKGEHVRVFHHEVKEKYALYDFVIVGIVNESHGDGIFNVETLGRIDRLTEQLLHLHRNQQGLPEILVRADRAAETGRENPGRRLAGQRPLAELAEQSLPPRSEPTLR